ASLYREPLWIFYRQGAAASGRDPAAEPFAPTTLRDFDGMRIAIGPDGSGTQAIALALLRDNEVPGRDPDKRAVVIYPTGSEAAESLKCGEVDVAFFVAAIDAEFLRKSQLFHTWGIELFPMNEQVAYLRRYRYLSGASLPRGLIDLGRALPPKDIPLVAPT